jgi:hypothetical protein
MSTLPILAIAAGTSRPSLGGASHSTGAKRIEFSQVLQLWDSVAGSGARPSADSGSDATQAESLSHESSPETTEEMSGQEQAALPCSLSTVANVSPEVAMRAATGSVAPTKASLAASSATILSTSSAASSLTSSSALQAKAKPQATGSPTKAGAVAESASGAGDDARFVFKSAQPFANIHSLGAENHFVQASSQANYSLLRSGTDVLSHDVKSDVMSGVKNGAKSSASDQSYSRGGDSSTLRETGSSAARRWSAPDGTSQRNSLRRLLTRE